MSFTIDSYTTQYTSNVLINSNSQGRSQSFLCDDSYSAEQIKWFLSEFTSCVGNLYAKIYAHSGTFGTSSIPTGDALATSDAIDASTLNESLEWCTFEFSTPFTLTKDTHYVLMVYYDGTGDVSVGRDDAGSHAGNYGYEAWDDSWAAIAGKDLLFYLIGSYTSGTTVTHTDNNPTLTNPYRGVVNNGGTTSPEWEGTLVNCYMSWKDIEAVKGVFDFSTVETNYHFTTHRAAGKKMHVLFYMDWPGVAGHKDIPDWLYTEISGDGTAYASGFSPNYENAIVIAAHARVMAAIGSRYNDDDFIWMFKIGSVGHWGECHTSYVAQGNPGCLPIASYQNQYYACYNTYLSNKCVAIRYPRQVALDYGYGIYCDILGVTVSVDWQLGIIADGYTDQSTSENPACPDQWKVAPQGGEFGNYPGTQHFADDTFAETTRQIEALYTTWVMALGAGYVVEDSDEDVNFKALLKTLGYRFYLKSITYPTSLTKNVAEDVTMTWTNAGLAPFYYDWKVAIALIQDSKIVYTETTTFDIRDWQSGDYEESPTITVPTGVDAGTYSLQVAIIDPNTDEPGIELAMADGDAALWYTIGNVEVEASNPIRRILLNLP